MAVMTKPQAKLLLACSGCKRQYDATGYAPRSRFHCACGETIEVPQVRSHDAAVVRCSSCSAPRGAGATSCRHCGADYTLHEQDLETICPSCMTRVSNRARYCHHCATPIAPQGKVGEPTDQRCPACRVRHKLNSRSLGESSVSLLECPHCAGIWLGQEAFRLVADRSRDDTLPEELIAESAAALRPMTANEAAGVMRYRRCPVCNKHMNRRNYGKRSGVIIDSCKNHGIWFDAAELGAILRWIRKGGEDRSARKDLEDERARKRNQAIKLPVLERADSYGNRSRSDWDGDSGGDLIGSLLGSLFNL
jgi:Zn-finger nucleic acid-binding protein/ribosomal protein L40E